MTGPTVGNELTRGSRVVLGHRVYESLARRLLATASARPGRTSAAELLSALLCFELPADPAAAAALLRRWGMLELGVERNPYEGERRVNLGHRVPGALHDRVLELAAGAAAEGVPARLASGAQLTQALLHFCLPSEPDDVAELLRRWAMLLLG